MNNAIYVLFFRYLDMDDFLYQLAMLLKVFRYIVVFALLVCFFKFVLFASQNLCVYSVERLHAYFLALARVEQYRGDAVAPVFYDNM